MFGGIQLGEKVAHFFGFPLNQLDLQLQLIVLIFVKSEVRQTNRFHDFFCDSGYIHTRHEAANVPKFWKFLVFNNIQLRLPDDLTDNYSVQIIDTFKIFHAGKFLHPQIHISILHDMTRKRYRMWWILPHISKNSYIKSVNKMTCASIKYCNQ